MQAFFKSMEYGIANSVSSLQKGTAIRFFVLKRNDISNIDCCTSGTSYKSHEVASGASRDLLPPRHIYECVLAMRGLHNANRLHKKLEWRFIYNPLLTALTLQKGFRQMPAEKNKCIVSRKTLNELPFNWNYTCRHKKRDEHSGRKISMNGVVQR